MGIPRISPFLLLEFAAGPAGDAAEDDPNLFPVELGVVFPPLQRLSLLQHCPGERQERCSDAKE